MNKLIEFSSNEKELLKSAIAGRRKSYKSEISDPQGLAKYLNRIDLIELQLKFKQSHLKETQKGLLHGIIQEYYIDPNQETIKDYKNGNKNKTRTESDNPEIMRLNEFINLRNKLLPKNRKIRLIEE